MTDRSFEEALNYEIALAGGHVTSEFCPDVMPPEQLQSIAGTIQMLGPTYDTILNSYGFRGGIAIALTYSHGFTCQMIPLGGDNYAILVPLGMPARVRVMARILLRYWGRETGVEFVRSLRDNLPVNDETVPRLLRPIFLNEPDPEGYWEALYELDNAVPADPKFEPDVYELVHLALVILTAHELTHILHGHWELRERSQRENFELSPAEIKRGLELDADQGSAAISMKTLHLQVESAKSMGQDVDLRRGWLRLSYVAAMLFGIFDAQRKYLYSYDTGSYNHPLVRCEIFSDAALRSLDASEETQNDLQLVLADGWRKCILAFNDLNLDVMKGVFGEFPKQMESGPLQSLVYARTDMMPTWKSIEKELKLVDQLRKLLPIYRASQGEIDQNASPASDPGPSDSAA